MHIMTFWCFHGNQPTVSVLEYDVHVLQESRGVRVLVDQQQRSHLGVIETTLWYSVVGGAYFHDGDVL